MTYALNVSGITSPLAVQTPSLPPGTVGQGYSYPLYPSNGTGPFTWSLSSGSVPPGLNVNPSGSVGGTPTTVGTYPFTVQVTDSSTPPQTATAQFSIQIGDPLQIISLGTLPNACVNQPYSFKVLITGGNPPIGFGLTVANPSWPAINLDSQTGVLSGTPTSLGTFDGVITLTDAGAHVVYQQISLTVQNCP